MAWATIRRAEEEDYAILHFLDAFPGGPQMIGRERGIMDAQEFAGRAARN